MSASSTADLIVDQITAFGTAGLVVLGATVVIIGGLILWHFGVRKFRGAAK